ncbi:MAG: hypothetical protein ACK52N_08390, partial [Lysobacteraceae bacterium]
MRPAVLIAFPLLFAASLALAQAPEPTPVPTPVAAPRPSTAPVAIPPAPRSSGAAWVLMDATSGRILAGENDDVPRALVNQFPEAYA